MDRAHPGFWGAEAAEDSREVILDPEVEEPVSQEEFLREQIPPHYS